MGRFAHYTVVRLDLAEHGASGRDRARWTMPGFGEDVVAVVEQLGLRHVVLIGHSMGGAMMEGPQTSNGLPDEVVMKITHPRAPQ